MSPRRLVILDADGHLRESITELAEFMDPGIRFMATASPRNRLGVFPSLDGLHYPSGEPDDCYRTDVQFVPASDHRSGSAEDWSAFLARTGMVGAVLYPTEGLSVGLIQRPEYALRLCRAYNDYVADRYQRVDARLRPVALVPMTEPQAAADELRRAVGTLGLIGAMLPSNGLPLHLGHAYYRPLYEAAAELECVLGVHGGSNRGMGIDSFTDLHASHVIHHPIPLLQAFTAMFFGGLFTELPTLRVAFLEGGCAWLALLLDRVQRDVLLDERPAGPLQDLLESGRVLIGCEGNDPSLGYLAGRVGVRPFAFCSDYPHEVGLTAVHAMIERTMAREDLSLSDKLAGLSRNASDFYRF